MKYYILTSNKYNFLLEGYVELFNKFWDSNIEVTILGFDVPNVILPKNFKFESLGKQTDWNTWTKPLIKYFNNVNDEYFFLSFEDHYLVNDVHSSLFNEAKTYCNGSVDKVYLMIDNRTIVSNYKGNFFNSLDRKGANVNNSLLPAIWKREFFLKLLDPNIRTAHDFEAVNNRCLNGKIIQSKSIIYPSVDAARRGGFNVSVLSQFRKNKSYYLGPYTQPIKDEAIGVFEKMQKKWNELYKPEERIWIQSTM